MKKFYSLLFTLMLILCISTKANAVDPTGYIPHKVIVKFSDDFSSKKPPKTFSITIVKDVKVNEMVTIASGTVMYFEVTKINQESIGKQDASVVARMTKVYVPSKNKTIDITKINSKAYAKFSKYEPLDLTSEGIDVGIKAVNKYVIKNITYPAHFVKGMVYNDTGNRLESGFKETYDSTVFSYASKGEPLILKSGDLATLTYYTKDAPEKLNTELIQDMRPTQQTTKEATQETTKEVVKEVTQEINSEIKE